MSPSRKWLLVQVIVNGVGGWLISSPLHWRRALPFSPVGYRPFFQDEESCLAKWHIYHVAGAVIAHVYTVDLIRELANQNDLHSAPNRSNVYAPRNMELTPPDVSDSTRSSRCK